MKSRPEEKLCIAFAEKLRELEALNQIRYPKRWFWTHIDNGQRAGANPNLRRLHAGIAKSMGTKPGVPDYFFEFGAEINGIECTLHGWIEYKAPKKTITDTNQKEFRNRCQETGVPWGFARSVEEGLLILQDWGVFKKGLHL